MPQRATKIVATLGPASSEPALLEQMIRAGVNVVRLNFSHGKAQDHIERAETVRAAARRAGVEVAIMADLQGPKIRVGKFADGKVMLEEGTPFVLDAARSEPGDAGGVEPWMAVEAAVLDGHEGGGDVGGKAADVDRRAVAAAAHADDGAGAVQIGHLGIAPDRRQARDLGRRHGDGGHGCDQGEQT